MNVAPFVYIADAEKRSDWEWLASQTGVDQFDQIITERCLLQSRSNWTRALETPRDDRAPLLEDTEADDAYADE